MDVLDPAPVTVGLVLTLKQPAEHSEAVLKALQARGDLTLGPVDQFWVPVASCTHDPRLLHRELESLPGVTQVDVVFVEMSEAPGRHETL